MLCPSVVVVLVLEKMGDSEETSDQPYPELVYGDRPSLIFARIDNKRNTTI